MATEIAMTDIGTAVVEAEIAATGLTSVSPYGAIRTYAALSNAE